MKKILLSLIISLITIGVCQVRAASYNFNLTGPTEATNGQTITLNITGTGLTGKVILSSSNATLSSSQVWVEKNTVNVTAKITGFPATITATPNELTDNDYNIVNIASKTITINEKKTQTGGSSGSNSGGSGSSGGTTSGGGSNSNSGTNKPSTPSKPNTTTKPSTGSSAWQSPDQTSVPNESNIQNGENVKSSNNYLQSITLSTGNLSPEFYRETFEYKVENIEDNLEQIEISAVAEDERASISGLGPVSLEPGENRLQINVTAENGNVREYILIVNKKEKLQESDLRLKTLEINKINREGVFNILEIPFDKENFEYSVEVEEDITDLDINPTVEKEGIIVETSGEKNLKVGDNTVLITLTSQDDDTIQTTYTIRVKRDAAVETLAQVTKLNETWKIITICILLVILASEVMLYIYLKKKRKIK